MDIRRGSFIMAANDDRNFDVIRGYLLAIALLSVGTAGVVVVGLQASQSPQRRTAPPRSVPPAVMAPPGASMTGPISPLPMGPISTPIKAAGADAGALPTAAMASPDGGIVKTTRPPDAAVPKVTEPAGPPKHPGPEPILVVSFDSASASLKRGLRGRLRKLIDKHGYKNVHYVLTGYAAEHGSARRNRSLARKRCRKIARQIRKIGLSRRWFKCRAPVYRKEKGKATAAHLVPAWRKVEIRVDKR